MQENKRVWVCENDPAMIHTYNSVLDSSFSVRYFDSIDVLLSIFGDLRSQNVQKPDLILSEANILDLIASHERMQTIPLPFMVISANDDRDIIKKCLIAGAIDYLCKPCKASELAVKIERFFAGTLARENKKKLGDISLSLNSFSVNRGDEIRATLTPKELQIFYVLNSVVGKPVSRSEIQRQVWQGIAVSGKTLDVHLFNLRKKLWQIGIEIRFLPPDSYALVCNRLVENAI